MILSKLIIFDLDDTLASTRTVVVDAMNYVLSLCNLSECYMIKKKKETQKIIKRKFYKFFGEEK